MNVTLTVCLSCRQQSISDQYLCRNDNLPRPIQRSVVAARVAGDGIGPEGFYRATDRIKNYQAVGGALFGWRKSGRLPAVRKGLRWLVDPADVTRMLEDTLEIKV